MGLLLAVTIPVCFLCARYSLFKPEYYWYRIVLMMRKLLLVRAESAAAGIQVFAVVRLHACAPLPQVLVALMFSATPLFQAWCVDFFMEYVHGSVHR